MSAVEVAENPYSRVIWWEVWNFMSIEHGKCEFDERNIINLKGYNDSGKSAMLNALKVVLANTNPTKQASFIQDDKDYFRVLVAFSDGVQILRDKYINGQSLYEMYHNGECIYSSKSGNALTRISEVPQPIADYLGLIMYDGACLNARACFEKQLGVQTTGSENYKMFNTVLKSEEIATAGVLLNNDKNKLAADINGVDSELQAHKNTMGIGKFLTEGMISYLKQHDAGIDAYDAMLNSLGSIIGTRDTRDSIPYIPEVNAVDMTQLSALNELQSIQSKLTVIPNIPEVMVIDSAILEDLSAIRHYVAQLSKLVDYPEVQVIESEQLSDLTGLLTLVESYKQCSDDIEKIDSALISLGSELENLEEELKSHGVAMIKCPDCGAVFSPEATHLH